MSKKLLLIARYTLLEAVRGRLPILVLMLLVAFVGIAEFAAMTTVTEPAAMRNGLLAVLWRWSAIVLMILFVISSMLREFDDRCIQLALAMPIARGTYLLGRYIGFALSGWCVALVAGACFVAGLPFAAVVQWSVSLGCELMLVTALGLLSVLTLGSVTSAGCLALGIYLLGRSIGAIQLIGHSELVARPDVYHVYLRSMADAVAYVVPDLARFTRSEWLIYPAADGAELAHVLVQTVVYVALLLACALFDLYRKSI